MSIISLKSALTKPKMIYSQIKMPYFLSQEKRNLRNLHVQISELATGSIAATDNFAPSLFFPPLQSSYDQLNGFSALRTLANLINILTKLFAADAFME